MVSIFKCIWAVLANGITYLKARRKVLQIEATLDIIRRDGAIGELAASQWGNAVQEKNRAEKRLITAIDSLGLNA